MIILEHCWSIAQCVSQDRTKYGLYSEALFLVYLKKYLKLDNTFCHSQ